VTAETRSAVAETQSSARSTVLLVEDEHSIGQLVRSYLDREGYRVVWVTSGEAALMELPRHPIALVVLDVGLPGMDGFDVCRRMRAISSTPIVMLTARSAETDKVLGFELGADDYVTKPFSITELLARVRAVLRRAGTQPTHTEAIRIGDLEVDFKLHQARRGKERVEFTAREFDLLRYLVEHTGRVVTREQILNEVWGYEEFPTTRTIDNFVAKLRQKIERAAHAPEHILTIHGSGYKFVG
jgi:DNA-binding response OmpR family regulator